MGEITNNMVEEGGKEWIGILIKGGMIGKNEGL